MIRAFSHEVGSSGRWANQSIYTIHRFFFLDRVYMLSGILHQGRQHGCQPLRAWPVISTTLPPKLPNTDEIDSASDNLSVESGIQVNQWSQTEVGLQQ